MATICYLDRRASCQQYTKKEQNDGLRLNKVKSTRYKLKSGKYNIDEHLSVALDRLLEELLK